MSKLKKATILSYWRWKLVNKIDSFVFNQIEKDNKLSNFWEKVYDLTDRLLDHFWRTYGFVRQIVHVEGNRYYERDVAIRDLDDRTYVKKIFKEYPEYTIDE